MTCISAMIIPTIISIILIVGLKEKKNVYDLFINGAKDGIKVVLKLFPTLIGIFLILIIINAFRIFNILRNMFFNKLIELF